jgi:type III secretory pathway lipoprotein EscJ
MSKLANVSALLVLACSCTTAPAAPRPDSSGAPGVEQLLGGSLIPSRAEARLLREHALAGELARTIESLDGVAEARVHLTLADRSLLAETPTGESSAAIVVRSAAGSAAPSAAQLRALASAVVPGVDAEAVQVFATRTVQRPPQLVAVGPLTVPAETADRAHAILGGLLGLCLVLAAGLIYAGVRLRRLRR